MRKILAPLLGLLMLSGLSVLFAPAASAAKSQCASSYMCLWHDQSYGSTLKQYHNDYNNLGSDSDEFHSAYNRDNVAWLLYADVNYQGTVKCIASGHAVADLGSYSFGDKISSIKKRTVAGCSGYTSIGS